MSGTLLENSPTEPDTDFANKETAVKDNFKLNTLDRCDKCSSQAYVEVTLTAGKLLFCGHHYKQQRSTLLPLPMVVKVRDESGRLSIKPVYTD